MTIVKTCTIILLGLLTVGVMGQDLTLNQAVEMALAHNPDLQRARREASAASAGFWAGISPDDPEVFMEFGGVADGDAWTDYRERKIGVVQSIPFPLAFAYRGQWHHQEKRRASAHVRHIENEVVSEVKKAFYHILLLKDKDALVQEMTEIMRKTMSMARVRVLAGESSPYDTLKVKVDLVEVENRALALRKAADVAESALNALLGSASAPLHVVGQLEFEVVALRLDSLHALTLARHPELAASDAQLRQSRAERSLAWMDLLPNLSVKYFRHDLPGEVDDGAWGGEIGISVPLWFLFKGQGSVRAAHYRTAAAGFADASERNRILLRVDEAHSRLIVAEQQVLNYRENTLREVDELVRIATRSYEEGEMGYLEMAEALRTMNTVRAGYDEALFEYLAAMADLETAVGVRF